MFYSPCGTFLLEMLIVFQLFKKSHHHFQNNSLHFFLYTETLEPTFSPCIFSQILILSPQSFVRSTHFLFCVQILYALPVIIMKNNFMYEGIWPVFFNSRTKTDPSSYLTACYIPSSARFSVQKFIWYNFQACSCHTSCGLVRC